jgi:hypothetical protein
MTSAQPELISEGWMVNRIAAHTGVSTVSIEGELFAGVSDRPERANRMREILNRHHLDQVRCGVDGASRSMTYAAAFEKLYHVKFTNRRGEPACSR